VVPNVSNECSKFTLKDKRSKINNKHGTDEEILLVSGWPGRW
jgi:hypothetical protein